jgi:FAD dependent oxidoreductase TIGR03364
MHCDLAIVGGGILGLAHAVAAVRRGLHVEIVERHRQPCGASVRNFGMIWPIGQPHGPLRELALRSAALWSSLAGEASFRCSPVGSLHQAYHDDEWATLQEFVARSASDEQLDLWSPEDCAAHAPATVRTGLRGGLFSASERSVDPGAVVPAIQDWLMAHGCTIHAPEVAVEVGTGFVRTAANRCIETDRVAICSGADFETLAPELFGAEWTKCRLQMMATAPQPGFALGPMRAAGLTLLHYRSFQDCPSLSRVRARVEQDMPEHVAHGVHVLVAQHADGSLILGDSHEYGRDFDPFHRESVDALILSYLRTFVDVRTASIARRWTGVYAVRRGEPSDGFAFPLMDGVDVVNGVGGAGMTLSLGLGERHVERWFGGA